MNAKIWIEPTGKTLRLVWYYEGKRHRLSLGIPDNSIGRALAAKKMAEIKIDLESGYYDPTLLKYRPRKLGANPTEVSAVQLFEKYLTHYQQERSLTRGSIVKLNGIASKLNLFLDDTPANKVTELVAKNVVAQWSKSASNRTVKEYLYIIKGCWDWAKDKYHVVDPNPWDDSLTRSRSRDNNRVPKQPKPFTIAEFQAIVSAFANHPQYSHYTDFVLFLANSACRPGEAAGLRWKHLGVDRSTAWIGESISRRNQKGTKTGKARTIQLNPVLKQILISRHERLEPQTDDLVFPSPKGVAIDDHNFCNRAWKTILTSCNIEYRTPYNLRHSAISHALAQGANPIALAEQTGHDKRVLLSTYAHAIDRPTADVREEVVFLIEKLLNYDRQLDLSQSIQIEAKWYEKNLKIKATIDRLVLLLPEIDPDRSPAQQKSHLGYLLTEILDKQLQILIDERTKNRHRNYQGIREWKFTLKLWYPPTNTDYIDLNLQALERHWNKTYKIKVTPTAPAPLNNLPQLRHTEFIGHREELKSLSELLATERQQTIEIVGMAGVGKTTLALEAAHQCLTESNFAAIIFSSAQSERFIGTHLAPNFIAEQNLRDLLQVIFRTLDRLDDLPTDITEQIRCIRSILTEQPTLLIVDNIENLIDRSDTIAFLDCLPPTVKVIITSRVRLGIGQVIDLHPLPARDSIDLIKHQAKTQNLQIDAIQFTPIHQLTGGLPLAIAYLIGAIATSGFTILKASPQSPLTTSDFALFCFAQSIAQLKAIPNSIAYQLLLSLSLFPDGASTAALAYITDASTISQDLQQLYQRSLAYPIGSERYYLHSLTQEYTQLELDRQPELAASLCTRWQNWYRDLAAPYGALDWQDWQDYSPLIAEWKNLRMAVDWCIEREQYSEVLQFWHCLKGVTLLSGYWMERQRWLGWLQEQAQQQQDFATIAELKYQHSFTLAFIDRSDSKGEAMELALATWEIRQDLEIDRQFELALYIVALYIRKLPQPDTQTANLELATVWIDRGLEILETLPADRSCYHRQYFQVYYYQAEIQSIAGQLDSAYDLYLQAHQFAQNAGWQRFIHYTSGWIAIILSKQGQFIEAEQHLSKVLKQMDKYHDVRAGTLCRKHLAEVNRSIGNTAAAKKFAKQAKSRFKQLGMTAEFKAMEEFLQALNIRPSHNK